MTEAARLAFQHVHDRLIDHPRFRIGITEADWEAMSAAAKAPAGQTPASVSGRATDVAAETLGGYRLVGNRAERGIIFKGRFLRVVVDLSLGYVLTAGPLTGESQEDRDEIMRWAPAAPPPTPLPVSALAPTPAGPPQAPLLDDDLTAGDWDDPAHPLHGTSGFTSATGLGKNAPEAGDGPPPEDNAATRRNTMSTLDPSASAASAPASPPAPSRIPSGPALAGAPAAANPGGLSTPPVSRAGLLPGKIGIAAARKGRGKLRVALIAPSGAGKTYDALLIAKGIIEGLGFAPEQRRGPGVAWWNYDAANGEPGGPARILVADTEAGSSNDYDQLVPFDVIELGAPYTIERYRAAYDQAVAGGYDVFVVDSGTHLWAGEGGILSEKDAMVRGGSRSGFDDWAKLTPKWEAFKTGIILNTKMHLIVTFRTKTAYETNDQGKRVKVGLDPIARGEIEYEFTVCFELDHAHQARVDKDRTSMYANRGPFMPTVETGKELIAWRMSGREEAALPAAAFSDAVAKAEAELVARAAPAGNGAPVPAAASSAQAGPYVAPKDDQVKLLLDLCTKLKTNIPKEKAVRGWAKMTTAQADELINEMAARALTAGV